MITWKFDRLYERINYFNILEGPTIKISWHKAPRACDKSKSKTPPSRIKIDKTILLAGVTILVFCLFIKKLY
jgi:hypothetical protein